jgi:hypothetical protein
LAVQAARDPSTVFVLRVREAQTPLWMTGSEDLPRSTLQSANLPAVILEFNLIEDRERG